MQKKVIVVRYGHRPVRDERVTSHCCLVARAFGAEKIIIAGNEDTGLKNSIHNVTQKWGNDFNLEFTPHWKNTIQKLKKQGFTILHLTMYGLPIDSLKNIIKKTGKLVLVIGSKKVEKEMFEISNYNVSITNQPHSEIAALTIALDKIFQGRELQYQRKKAKLKIIPSTRRKIVKKI